ncbi:hypothetical protein UFOVP204_52 [uncultured Caudovirales phage]|uniref:Uncharacterized protein n=1 Tax=uncultured Caudovirales phage TaxID=2100421 RepID=A0A6J7WK32_9CAUD|nr:hypothetical protein UFOVP204_52 [uncultured Caudovirales phage]
MTKDEAKLAYGLVGLYCTLYKDTYKKSIVVNKYREKWAMQDVVDSVGYDRAKTLLEYYFQVKREGHPISWFFYNFEKLDMSLQQKEEDKTRRELIRAKTKSMVKERDDEY